jgi:ABC-type nitrate/sulfonate/bicarbonate transport system ATPase subunit
MNDNVNVKTSDAIISVRHVSKTYHDTNFNPVRALEGIDLDIARGDFISIIGPSGCGKTTLLRLIAGLDRPETGSLTINGEEIREPGPERGYIFQQPTLFPWLTVFDNAALGLRARGLYKDKKDMIQRHIDMIGLTGFERSYPHEISGGMAQRVAIIRALINEPEILLLDEPLGALDAFKRMELQEQLQAIWRSTGATFAMVTHDVDEAIVLSNRIVIMSARPGRIVAVIDAEAAAAGLNRNADSFIALRKTIFEKLHLAASGPEPEYAI